ncbi:MAG: sigma-E processing peptidase SpoIIGA [Bacilli bacterium]|nr:sigma-E processing peptidase SpoIIGA [Bacilli bacterium]
MTLYLDLIFLLNIWFDFLLLLTVSILLKRNVKLIRIVIGSIVGGLTIFILFIKFNNITLFLFKILVSLLIVIVTFSYKNLKYTSTNLGYFYLTSIILGGGMYLISDLFSYNNNNLVFYHNGFQINYIVLLIISPIILLFYIRNVLKLKDKYSNYHKVDMLYKNKLYHLNGYLDTGNNLKDIYKKRGVVLVNLNINIDDNYIYTPYNALNYNGIVKCIKPDKLYVDSLEFNNYLIGISNEKFKIEGIDCILHSSMKGKLK